MEEKKGKKECQRPIFQASFRLKEKRTLWRPRRRRVVSPPPQPSSCRRLTVSIFLVFVFFLFTISARQLYTPPLPPHTLSLRTFTTPTRSIVISSPPFCPAPLRGAYCCTVYYGTMQTATMARRVVVGGFVFKSFFLILTLTNTHHFIISCFPPPTYTHTYTHTDTVPLLPQSLRTLCVYVCVCAELRFFISLSVNAAQPSRHRIKGVEILFLRPHVDFVYVFMYVRVEI